eukprot:CAMPEP_0168506830 /NCGR_PEP_ID=MMETSP0228-20121227/77574_1 /TAXON_ID=133427 /ORGANISM="Protoceratium reticulatum, Strain CCCM 535 (=CCMP 1889)" /LENGTH=107 /DNA_ID=CAMNT_0008523931 /DNA_START=140 /DNA_END=459 /DNA_ORIENTATION=-
MCGGTPVGPEVHAHPASSRRCSQVKAGLPPLVGLLPSSVEVRERLLLPLVDRSLHEHLEVLQSAALAATPCGAALAAGPRLKAAGAAGKPGRAPAQARPQAVAEGRR